VNTLMIRRVLALVLFFAGLPISCAAQLTSEVRIDSTKPTVYLAFERLGENGLVWLRLHNNTEWALSLSTETPGAGLVPLTQINGKTVSALADGSEISPEYLHRKPFRSRLWRLLVHQYKIMARTGTLSHLQFPSRALEIPGTALGQLQVRMGE
jgi:hypothetical protein